MRMGAGHGQLTRAPTWSPATGPNLDLFWLKDESLEESANLPSPDVIAAEIVEDLEAALEQYVGFEAGYLDGGEVGGAKGEVAVPGPPRS